MTSPSFVRFFPEVRFIFLSLEILTLFISPDMPQFNLGLTPSSRAMSGLPGLINWSVPEEDLWQRPSVASWPPNPPSSETWTRPAFEPTVASFSRAACLHLLPAKLNFSKLKHDDLTFSMFQEGMTQKILMDSANLDTVVKNKL